MAVSTTTGPTIAAGASLSDALDVSAGKALTRINIPSAWLSARLSFQVSEDGITFVDLFSAQGEVVLNVTAGTTIDLAGLGEWKEAWFKFRSGISQYPIVQPNAVQFISTIETVSGTSETPVFSPSGPSHSTGLVPDPGAVAGTTKFLREDATFAVPPAGGGGVTDGNKGDVTVSGGGAVWELNPGAVGSPELANGAVIFAKLQDINTDRLIGRDTAATGDPEELTVGGGLEFTGALGIQRSAITGDVSIPAGSNTATLAATIAGEKTWTSRQLMAGLKSSIADGNQFINLGTNATISSANRWLFSHTRYVGSILNADTWGQQAVNVIFVQDEVDVRESATNLFDALEVTNTVVAGRGGSHNAVHTRLQITGNVNADGPDTGGQYAAGQVSCLSTGYSTSNQGGDGVFTGGAFEDGYKGAIFAGNDNIWLSSGATYYSHICGREIDVAIDTGASSFYRWGLLIMSGGPNQAIDQDGAIVIGNFGGAVVFKDAINVFTNITDAVLAVRAANYPTPGPNRTADYGIDFRELTATTAVFASTGFTIGPTGKILDLETAEFADDAAASAGGVPVGGVYRTASALKVRVT